MSRTATHSLPANTILICFISAGIGFATIQHLARRGAKVYMAARNEQKAKAAIERLQAEGLSPGNGEVHWLKLDLSDPREVKRATEEFMQKEDRLDVLGEYCLRHLVDDLRWPLTDIRFV